MADAMEVAGDDRPKPLQSNACRAGSIGTRKLAWLRELALRTASAILRPSVQPYSANMLKTVAAKHHASSACVTVCSSSTAARSAIGFALASANMLRMLGLA